MSKLQEVRKRVFLEHVASVVEPVFCSDCGAKMYPIEAMDSAVHGKYDKGGRRQYTVIFKCPYWRWYYFGFKHGAHLRLVKEV